MSLVLNVSALPQRRYSGRLNFSVIRSDSPMASKGARLQR